MPMQRKEDSSEGSTRNVGMKTDAIHADFAEETHQLADSHLTLYLRDKATHAQLAEIHVSADATVEELRSHIRDCPEMAALPQRLFSHWWLKIRSVFPLEIPTDSDACEYLLSEAGIEDEGTLLLELRGVTDAAADTEADGYAAAVVAADRRSEQRIGHVLKVLAEMRSSLTGDVSALKADNASLRKEMQALTVVCTDLTTANAELKNTIEAIQAQAASHYTTSNELRENLAARVDEVHAVVSVQPHPSCPPLTVATPCGPSTFTISYPDRERKAVVVGHKQYFGLPSGALPLSQPIHFPKAPIPVGARCLVEFTLDRSPTATSGCGLVIGFAPASSPELKNPVHDLWDDQNSYTLGLFGTYFRQGQLKIADMPKISSSSSVRRVAVLMDRTDKSNSFLRVFVSEDGTDDGFKPHGDAKTIIQPSDEEYIPAANLVGMGLLTIRNILFGTDIPLCFMR